MTVEEFKRDVASRIPPAHPDIEQDFRDECIRHRFILYDGKKNRAVCTNCGNEWDLAPGEYANTHGTPDECPCCGEKVFRMSAGRGRLCYEEKHRLMSFASDGKSLWIILNDILVGFTKFGRAQLYIHAREVFEINAEEQHHWRHMDGWFSYPPYWQELKSFNPEPLPSSPYTITKWDSHIFTKGLDEVMENSDCRYLVDDDFARELDWSSVATWLALQMKYPALELLRKGGFWNLAQNKINGNNYQNAVNIRARSIEKALRLPKKWVKALRRADISETITPKELKAFQKANDKLKQAATESWDAYRKLINHYRAEEYALTIRRYTTLESYLRYMKNQKTHDPIMFVDYIENAHLLGYDLRRKSVLFPANLKQAHDEAAEARKIEKNTKRDELIRMHAIAIDYRLHDLMALPAMSQQDLNNESSVLHHCVKTYGDRVAEGRTLIYFVRRESLPDEPYYTLEISPKDGHVVQCRGLKNCSMTAEVKEFKEGFEKAFTKMLKREDTLCRAKA